MTLKLMFFIIAQNHCHYESIRSGDTAMANYSACVSRIEFCLRSKSTPEFCGIK